MPGPGQPRGAAIVIPGPPGMMGAPGMMGIPALPGMDPFLPCQSRHIVSHRAQAMAGQPGQVGTHKEAAGPPDF